MTWILIIGSVWAIPGYATKEECLKAAEHVRMGYIIQCVPKPVSTPPIVGSK